MVRYILFDFDGTLVDSRQVFLAVFNQLAEKYGYRNLRQEDLAALRCLSIADRCRFLKFPLYRIPFVIYQAYHLYRKQMKDLVLFDGIRELLAGLKSRGYQLGIISSNAENNIREFLLHQEIDTIEEIACSGDIFGKGKMIRRFLKAKGLENSEVIYVGDELRDILACQKNGVKVVWVGWGFDGEELIKEAAPDFIVRSPEEILRLVWEKSPVTPPTDLVSLPGFDAGHR
ncbi:HAD family hydrolase [soil metagenome]